MKPLRKAKMSNIVTENLFKAIVNALVNTILNDPRFLVVNMTSGRR